MKKYLTIFPALLILLSSQSYAYHECRLEPKKIYSGLSTNDSIWLMFENSSSVALLRSEYSEEQVSRALALFLTAKTTGSKLVVRVDDDNITCPFQSTRYDAIGIWLE